MDCASGEKFNTRRHADKAAAWGWEQAIPEREELAGLLNELLNEIQYGVDVCDLTLDSDTLIARARAAAERLRGGGSDG
jgi:hypothetical protein